MDWLKLSKEAYDASTSFIDSNWRADWDYSLRAFRNEHAAGSKYLTEDYKARSRIFRPKTRSIIRKNEAAGHVALFSNMEMVDLQAGNPDDLMSLAARDCMKALLEYRLQKSIPTFEICMGGIQDAQTQGVVVSYQYWEYEKRGERLIKDKPCIELRPIENIRLDGGASWLDPVNTSPYWCDIIPMAVCNVRAMMDNKDEKTGAPKWKKFEDKDILAAKPDEMDRARQARLGKQQDPHTESTGISSFDIVWVMRWFMKDSQGEDHCFYTLGNDRLLTDPKPIEEVYFHGRRPYEMGYAILETHKVIKTSMPVLTRPLQQETNAVANDRLDNVKFVLHKRWFVARGKQVDVQSLVRGAPGGVTLVNDPKLDVQESNWPDVTSSAYVEQDRLNADFDDLAGNFSPSTKVANNAMNDTLGGSKMAAQGAGVMTDYLLRTIIETWWEKVLRQLCLLEAYYETDEKVLALCANKAKLFPRYGLSQITDDLLKDDVTLTVNVAMGAGDPNVRFQKFMVATNAALQVIAQAPPGFNVQEAIKEIYANAGYRDGTRFFGQQEDPRLMKAMQMVQQLTQMVKGKQLELQAGLQQTQMKNESAEKMKAWELGVDQGRIQGDLRIRDTETAIEAARVELDRFIAEVEGQGMAMEQVTRMREMAANIQQAHLKLTDQRLKNEGTALKIQGEIMKQRREEREATAA